MHPLDALLEFRPGRFGPTGTTAVFTCKPRDRYRNAIGPFGGWIAALLLKGVLSMPEARGAPLTLDALFMGSIDDGDLEVRVFALMDSRSSLARRGYVDQFTSVWSASGSLLAQTQQMLWFADAG